PAKKEVPIARLRVWDLDDWDWRSSQVVSEFSRIPLRLLRRGVSFVARKFAVQPGASEGPVSLGSTQRYLQGRGRFGHGEPREIAKLDQRGGRGIGRFQASQGIVHSQKVVGNSFDQADDVVELDTPVPGAAFELALAAGLFNKDAPHGLGGGTEEVAA